ncbi:MAG TPA: hypothetical protein VHK88_06385, partial [Aquihabitans sp.]|nr:hypothetical protein [Aquihabitans sp.]
FGIRDLWPVITEPFSQWVVEDSFCNGRPPLDEVGVQFVADVTPYALMKTRMLNGSHCALGYLGTLAGYTRSDEAMEDPIFDRYLETMMQDEIAPSLPATDIDLARYGAALRRRFANPAVADQLSRLCRNGSTKVPAHLLTSISAARHAQRPHPLLTLAVAGWCRYLRGVDGEGRNVDVDLDDPAGARLRTLARRGGSDPRPLLADEATFGHLGACPGFADAIAQDLQDLETQGPRAVLAARTSSESQLVSR